MICFCFCFYCGKAVHVSSWYGSGALVSEQCIHCGFDSFKGTLADADFARSYTQGIICSGQLGQYQVFSGVGIHDVISNEQENQYPNQTGNTSGRSSLPPVELVGKFQKQEDVKPKVNPFYQHNPYD